MAIKDLAANIPALQKLVTSSAVAGLKIDHAIESPDTLVDDCALLTPIIDILRSQVLTSHTTSQANLDSAKTASDVVLCKRRAEAQRTPSTPCRRCRWLFRLASRRLMPRWHRHVGMIWLEVMSISM